MAARYGSAMDAERADGIIRYEIGKKFETCLEHTGVFKQTADGLEAFNRFMETCGFTEEV